MASVIIEEQIEVPADVATLAAFRRWVNSIAFPDRGRIDFVLGKIEVDMSPEDLFIHGTVKTEIVVVLGQRIRRDGSGRLFTDSTRITSSHGDLSAEPDVVFLSNDKINNGDVRLVPKSGGQADRYIELEGGPDLIAEIVSDSSVNKDTQRLPKAYFAAGVQEYWLIDARTPELLFRIYRRGKTSFEETPSEDSGFLRSDVMGCSYRLVRSRDADDRLQFTLEEQE